MSVGGSYESLLAGDQDYELEHPSASGTASNHDAASRRLASRHAERLPAETLTRQLSEKIESTSAWII